MAILLFILRLIGWVLLAVLLLLLVALLIPLGIRFAYRPDSVQATAYYGPLHFTLWPRRGQPEAPKKPASAAPPGQTVRKTADGEQASVTVEVKPDKPVQTAAQQTAAQGKPEAPKPADSVPAESAGAEGSAKKGGLPFGISARIDAAMQLLSNDPTAFARCMLGHTGWLGRRLLRSVRVSGLDIFWTVTADEASATAELFGAEMALANNLLALVQQYIRVQSDRLWLEPDFTGERAGERIVSFRLTSCAAVLLWLVIRLLHRLWKDPQLQPAAKA